MRWIDAKDLARWASRRDAQEKLPLLIRRLIRVTGGNIGTISFPAGDSIVYSGWDGKVVSIKGTEYIPQGLSLWELSTRKDIKRKAEEDYKKRKNDPLGKEHSMATYVFVTLRIWDGKEKWVKEKRNEKFWRDVRVYDARDLEEWIEQAPGVGIWLGKLIGKYPQEYIISLEDWWNEWSQITHPPLSPELIVGSRDEQMRKVKEWLNTVPSRMVIQASTEEEAIAFLAAVILTLSEEEREYFLSKALVITNEEAFRNVVSTLFENDLLLVTKFEEIERVSLTHNHHVYVPLGRDNTVIKDSIVLPRNKRGSFVSALVKMGIDQEQANRLAKDTAMNITMLRRVLAPISKQPEWARPERVKELLPALLLEKWHEKKRGDREIVEEISEMTYHEYVRILQQWRHKSGPPISKFGDMWRLTSPLDAFFALSPYLTELDLEKFKKVSLKVLREIDPSLDLEPEKRWMASIYGKERMYSRWLREGIAQFLVLLAVFGGRKNLDLSHSPKFWVDGFVRELLSNADWKLWHSLSDVLTLIAEASPLSFLDAVEDSLSQESPPIMGMFSEAENTFTSRSAHSNLLWALEELAWDPELLARVTLILGKLTSLDPGGKSENRPINSLKEIFRLWHPQTFATLKQRLDVLDVLIEKQPDSGWKLLIELLPRRGGEVSFGTYTTRWRQFSDRPMIDSIVTIKEYVETLTSIVDRILKNVDHDGKKWRDVMDHFLDLPLQERRKLLRKLSNIIELIKEGRLDLWNKLREVLSHSRSFPDAERALTKEELKKLEKIYKALEPENIIKRYIWLFDSDWPALPEGNDWKNYEKTQEVITQKRIKAIKHIKSKFGIEGLLKLAEQSRYPWIIGSTTLEIPLTKREEETLLSYLSLEDTKTSFVQGYVWKKSLKRGDTWVQKIVNKALSEHWDSIKTVNLFLGLPQNQFVWNFLQQFDGEVQQDYWRKVRPIFFASPLKEQVYALKKLMSVKRNFIALYIAAINAKKLSAKLIVRLLWNAAKKESIDDFNIISPWHIEQLFNVLDQSEDIEKEEIAKLEWLYLPALASPGSGRPPKMLHSWLSNDPEFFAEVIRWVYEPKNEEYRKKKEELPEELRVQRAHLAWELLYSWKTVPGSNKRGKIYYQKLRAWIVKSRELCRKQDRLESCDIRIGEILAYAISDEEGNWPPEEVCRVIDNITSKELEEGFVIGVRNRRGIITKSPFEGGNQERELVEHYRTAAKRLAIKFPRTSAILKEIALGYEIDAKREDEDVQRREIEG